MADGVRASFEDFYAGYHRRIRAYAITAYGRDDADDLAQDVMVKAYASYARLDPARDPWPWLVTILRNVARDRRARREPLPVADLPVSAPDGTADADERAVVRAALGRLPAADREMLLLREVDELTFDELAVLLGRSRNALRQQAFRARRKLADAYTAIGGRAVALAGWCRWRTNASAVAPGVAAGVVAVTIWAGGTPPARPDAVTGPPPGRTDRGAAGPVPHGGTRTGPAARSAAPERPLLPPGATPFPAPAAPQGRPAPSSPPPDRAPRDSAGTDAGNVGHVGSGAPAGGEGVVCALTALCDPRQNSRG